MMKILLSSALPGILRWQSPHLGRLFGPRNIGNVAGTSASIVWAADNDAWKVFDEARFRWMLKQIQGFPGCAFVSAPDVVGDSEKTLNLYETWAPIIRSHGLPSAFVLQDGQNPKYVPWEALDAVFVGGSTQWKTSLEVAAILKEAQQRKKWRHFGRVNTINRLRLAHSLACNSVDGTGWSRFAKRELPTVLKVMDELATETQKEEDGA